MLSDFQSHKCDCSKEYRHNEEAHHYLRLRNRPERTLNERIYSRVALHLEVVVQRCHLEAAAAGAGAALGIFEIAHLQHHREILHKEDGAQYGDKTLLAYEYSKHRYVCTLQKRRV